MVRLCKVMPSLGTVLNKFANKRLNWGYFVQSNGKFIILRLQDIHVAEKMLKLELNTNQSVYQFCYLIVFFNCILTVSYICVSWVYLCRSFVYYLTQGLTTEKNT